ncbi:somatostatin receptor type 2-like [Topomyia yanbarensis]|uniref:somatostatin receptor type 2-like n=1 Tax=Topomyia yanbarensis TaxID=2498891 RepID=UPI00273CC679|nr:somatostatin receptor type 2-like [Topomyia yanbarensis]XP_058838584.1 somatostatin receptor type 2-like [Topomyia yanbarensis]XP_058838585.1 somatostatin receptor type 2-like [Topomyia yanbarensis]XP_058838586.1 somatostatin receptor type 2-like [Topomyia yanbarensis]XP_058838587.1 somatostatin receptor type 2-like [Topomyia yanbarensis]XP_058838588.1 somatostatin receptor type 2-like [Topomyia yanbarensis]XP_058838589.1 somatostatin receptor type 2-like [Topomyia yanbarensis]XP_05883859
MDSNLTYFLTGGGLFGDNSSLDEFVLSGSDGGGLEGSNETFFHSNFTCPPTSMPITYTIFMILYAVVCLIGVMGNTLVIYVVLRFSNMQTVTNMYILNLAIADECFLIGIPFLIATMHMRRWVFSGAMCKAYMVSTSITQFTSSIFLFIMSADRYIAICHHISSPKYRTPLVSRVVSALAWLASAIIMLPIMIYGNSVEIQPNTFSCQIVWPESHEHLPGTTFTLYSLILGFVIPLCFIMTFYCLVIRKLRNVGPKTTNKSRGKRRSHRKVTKLVLTVITVYILCWLPYWISQVALITSPAESCQTRLDIILFLLVGCLGYINSAINPILYAYLSENFKKSFMKACTCAARAEVNAQLKLENSVMPKRSRTRTNSDTTQLTTSKVQHRLLIDPTTTGTTTTTAASTVSSRNPSPPIQRSLMHNNNNNNNNGCGNHSSSASNSGNNAKNCNNEQRPGVATTHNYSSINNRNSTASNANSSLGELVQLS